jgi:hypothetical protein
MSGSRSASAWKVIFKLVCRTFLSSPAQTAQSYRQASGARP